MRKAVNGATTDAIKPRWRPCWPSSPHPRYARESPSPFYDASLRPSAIPKLPSACNKPKANSSNSCGSRRKGGGNDGGCKTLRVSHPPWKSLRDSHIPTAPTTARLVPYKPRKKGAFLRHPRRLPSGSFFDWKRLLAGDFIASVPVLPIVSTGKHSATKRRTSRSVANGVKLVL